MTLKQLKKDYNIFFYRVLQLKHYTSNNVLEVELAHIIDKKSYLSGFE